ncbi:MAG: class I SAM-dependent methyltransferase [Pseudanabaenaceae cyanobacterium]
MNWQLWRDRFRSWLQPSAVQTLPLQRFASYEAYQQRPRQSSDLWALERSLLPPAPRPFTYRAQCFVCQGDFDLQVDFQYAYEVNGVWMPNWRESLICPSCGLNNRMRAAIQIFLQVCPNPTHLYLTEQTTALYRWLAQHFPQTVGSEYLGETLPWGAINEVGIRNESLTHLTWGDRTFDAILSFDVLEHVPDYQAALREVWRCLRPGGHFFFSVPFRAEDRPHLVRARYREDGTLEHLQPPEYHGDPINPAGCLCFYHFGWELLADLRRAGFRQAEALTVRSPHYGYLGGEQLFFLARR